MDVKMPSTSLIKSYWESSWHTKKKKRTDHAVFGHVFDLLDLHEVVTHFGNVSSKIRALQSQEAQKNSETIYIVYRFNGRFWRKVELVVVLNRSVLFVGWSQLTARNVVHLRRAITD